MRAEEVSALITYVWLRIPVCAKGMEYAVNGDAHSFIQHENLYSACSRGYSEALSTSARPSKNFHRKMTEECL